MISRMNEADISLACGWFKAQTGVELNPLLMEGDSFLFSKGAFPVACITLYKLPKVAIFGWPIGNPNSCPEDRVEAFNALMKHCEKEALESGCLIAATYSSRNSVTEIFKRNGYLEGEKCVQVVKKLGE